MESLKESISEFLIEQSFLVIKETPVPVSTDIKIGRPPKSRFIRVNPEFNRTVLTVADDREIYLVHPKMMPILARDLKPRRLILCVDTNGQPYLWPIRIESDSSKYDSWTRSALEIIQLAQENWVRVLSNLEISSYQAFCAEEITKNPSFPASDDNELIALAFKGRTIASDEHPVVQRLLGKGV